MESKAINMKVEEIIKRLISNRNDTFFVNTTAKVVSADKNVKEGNKWVVGRVVAENIDATDTKIKFRINLWDSLSILVSELEKGDILEIKNGQAKNYCYKDKTYPQINCDERYGSCIEIKYKSERILVDGSNVAWSLKKNGKPNIDNIEIVRLELEKQGYKPIIIVDANLRHLVSEEDKERLEKWIDEEKVIQAPAHVKADDALLKFADERRLKIVSNDTFKGTEYVYPWLNEQNRRVPFTIIGGKVVLHFR
ncbi:MAG: hypothetical protein AB1485_05740 [Candidatus Thermoplasmatota archaeon]